MGGLKREKVLTTLRKLVHLNTGLGRKGKWTATCDVLAELGKFLLPKKDRNHFEQGVKCTVHIPECSGVHNGWLILGAHVQAWTPTPN